jgi:hypothetical protein
VPGEPVKSTYPGKAELDDLFNKVQVKAQFNSQDFSTSLQKYATALGKG